MAEPTRVRVIDSHTGGEPTRVVLDGGPALAGTTMGERRADFASRFDRFRSAIVNEPRGSDVLVGALLTPPEREDSDAGVVFFNNVGMLGMCGHGTIGVVETLRHLGRVREGTVRLDTPVGLVEATMRPDGAVAFDNVASYRTVKDVGVHLDEGEHVVGDVAYGGNWFFLASAGERPIALEHVGSLTAFTTRIRAALERAEITGEGGAEIDHVELYTESDTPGVDSRNFVLCPGMAYDRSPCGTGTSAKVACLAQDGKLAEGELWRQESVTGSVFEAKVRRGPNGWLPTIAGRAWVTGESTLLLNPEDPLCWGLGVP